MNGSKLRFSLIILSCMLCMFSLVLAASAQTTVVRAEASSNQPRIGETLTVNIEVSNAQNLYGVDITLNWNQSVLKVLNETPQLGVETHSNGVLHESQTYPIEIIDNTASQTEGKYHLLATSTGSSTPAFTGSGTIVTLTFNVTNAGPTGLALNNIEISQLTSDGTANLVTPSTTVDSVNASVPEFTTIIIVIAIAVLGTATIAASTILLKKHSGLNHTGVR